MRGTPAIHAVVTGMRVSFFGVKTLHAIINAIGNKDDPGQVAFYT
jgi:hypothetical protein